MPPDTRPPAAAPANPRQDVNFGRPQDALNSTGARPMRHNMHVRAFGSVGLYQRLQRGEVLPHGVGVTLELLIGHLRTLPESEDHFAPIAVADDP